MPKRGQKSAPSSAKLEETLIHNLVELQKVHTHLAERFDKLATNIDMLLRLFETAARSFAHGSPQVSDKDREFLEKIDRLLDQNKTIAKGLTLMEERMRDRIYGSPQAPTQTPQAPPMPPRFDQPRFPEQPRQLPRI